MFSIGRNGVITLNRGDTFTVPFYVNIGTQLEPVLYPMIQGDVIYFGVMEPNKAFEKAIIKKKFTYQDYDYKNNCVRVKFNTTDTEYLVPGTYYYSAKLIRHHNLQTVNGTQTDVEELVDTIVPRTKFIILE